jgi:hypothetical protein
MREYLLRDQELLARLMTWYIAEKEGGDLWEEVRRYRHRSRVKKRGWYPEDDEWEELRPIIDRMLERLRDLNEYRERGGSD